MKQGQRVWVLMENIRLDMLPRMVSHWSAHPGIYTGRRSRKNPSLRRTRSSVLAIRLEKRQAPSFFDEANVFLSRQDAEAAAALRVLK